jgi:hypothetical protein
MVYAEIDAIFKFICVRVPSLKTWERVRLGIKKINSVVPFVICHVDRIYECDPGLRMGEWSLGVLTGVFHMEVDISGELRTLSSWNFRFFISGCFYVNFKQEGNK